MMDYSHYFNEKRFDIKAQSEAEVCVKNLANWTPAVDEIRTWPEYSPQPLRALPGLAKKLGIGQLFVKDESRRFGPDLGSFKALGAPYAVYEVLAEEVYARTGTRPTSAELRILKYHDITKRVTVCVATDGNQGRGLAYGAKIFGCRCVDYIHNHVSEGRADAMRDLGAVVIRVDGEYELSVTRAKEDARMNGWHFVSSTSWSDFDDDIPQNVMNAYMTVAEEAISMLPSLAGVTHLFVCGGVGSIAAAVFNGFYKHLRLGETKQSGGNNDDESPRFPRFVIVEPSEADCLFQSAKNGEPRESKGTLRTLMAGLACRTPSPAAWKVLNWLASDFVTVPDSVAVDGMRALASGGEGDVPIVIGESSAASVGLLLGGLGEEGMEGMEGAVRGMPVRGELVRGNLGLDESSQVVIFGLEGATDPKIYESLVGVTPQEIFDAQDRVLAGEKWPTYRAGVLCKQISEF
ncbi:hypothetical protein AAE478_006588 [Parahypoxylon ruwenzoriense]